MEIGEGYLACFNIKARQSSSNYFNSNLLLLPKNMLRAAFLGYWMGKFIQNRVKTFTTIYIVVVVIHHFWVRYKYNENFCSTQIYVPELPKIIKNQIEQVQNNESKIKQNIFKLKKVPKDIIKSTNIEQLVQNLPETYFN